MTYDKNHINYKNVLIEHHKKDIYDDHENYDKTFQIVKSHLDFFGITRIANITGLDRIGIPVVNVIRPNLNEYSVAHGKGVTLKAAMLSGIMESVERYHGFNKQFDVIYGTYAEIDRQYAVPRLDTLALSKGSIYNEKMPIKWVLGWDILGQQEVAVPYDLVTLNTPPDVLAEPKHFQSSSNGLAAGTIFLEAVLQGLVEVIERDAVTCHQLAAKAKDSHVFPLKKINLQGIHEEVVSGLIEKIRDNEIDVEIFDCTIDTDIPAYNCFLIDKLQPQFGLCHGMGAGLNSDVALRRAVTEAVQARAVLKAGVRESFLHDQFVVQMKNPVLNLGELLKSNKNVREFSYTARDDSHVDYARNINLCLEKCKKNGIEHVIVLDITDPRLTEIKSVKVIVPGLEGYMLPNYIPGPRGLDFANGRRVV